MLSNMIYVVSFTIFNEAHGLFGLSSTRELWVGGRGGGIHILIGF